MTIKTFEDLKVGTITGLYDLTEPNLQNDINRSISEWEVRQEEFMRPDILMKSLYDVDDINDLDIILYLNGIDNPLSIRPGMKIIYPTDANDLIFFRYSIEVGDIQNRNIKSQIAIPNKTTRKDAKRRDFLDRGYSLPPVVLDKPKEPVRIEGNNILIGGL